MMDEIELSKSDRAKCKVCGKKIGKNTPRLIVSTAGYRIGYSYYCYKCSKDKLKNEINRIKMLQNKLNKMIKSQNKEIILSLL